MAFLTHRELAATGIIAGTDARISVDARIFGGDRITIGDNVRIDAFAVLSAGEAGTVRIGSHIHLASGIRIFGQGGVVVGDFASMSAGSTIYSASDDFSGAALMGPTLPERYTSVTERPVVVERFAAIAAHSLVLPGVTLHEGAVLGSMSLATHDLDAWTIHAGVPCSALKPRRRDALRLAEEFLAEWRPTPAPR